MVQPMVDMTVVDWVDLKAAMKDDWRAEKRVAVTALNLADRMVDQWDYLKAEK